MLKAIRKNTKLILWVLLLLIVPPFVFFGIESAFVKKNDRVMGVLFGQKVSLSDFLKAKSHAAAMISLRQPQGLDDTFVTHLAWQRLVFLYEARRSGFRVSDEELSQAIQKAFAGKDGFDPKMYQLFVEKSLHLPIFEFEKAFRETLLMEKYQNTLAKLVDVSEDEIYESFFYENQKIETLYCEIPSERFLKDVVVSSDEVKAYFDEHKEAFRVGIQRSVEYISISLKQMQERIELKPEEIEAYYNQHKDIYKEPLNQASEKIQNDLKGQKAYEKAGKLVNRLYRKFSKRKAHISEIAQKEGFAIQSVPFFVQENPPQIWKDRSDVSQQIFSGKLNRSLKPLLVQDFYYLIIPKEEKASYLPELSEVESKVRDILIETKSREEAKKQAGLLLEKVRSAMLEKKLEFSQACQESGEKSLEIPAFTRDQAHFPNDPLSGLKNKAWDLKDGDISDVLTTQKVSAFVYVSKRVSPTKENFEKVKASLRDRVRDQKRQRIFYEYYDSLMKECQIFDMRTTQVAQDS